MTHGPPAAPAATIALADLPLAALLVDAGRIVAANPLADALLGLDLVGAPLGAVLAQDPPRGTDWGGGRHVTWRTEAETGGGIPFLVDVTARRCPDGTTVYVLQEVSAPALLGAAGEHLGTAFDLAPIGMAFFDTEGRYIRVNRALCELLDRPVDALLGRRDAELTHPDDRKADVDASWQILRGELDAWQTEKRFVRPDGSTVWVIASLTFLRDDERRPLTWLGQFQDITPRKALEERLRVLADEDPLTGLANRRRLDHALADALALARRHGHGGALVYVDLNGFKAVNDTHGHETGDALLRAAAVAMRGRSRATDTVARVGGDEFAVLLPIVTETQARKACGMLQTLLEAVTVPSATGPVALRATLGLTCFGPDDARTPDEVIAAADRAMYEARRDPA